MFYGAKQLTLKLKDTEIDYIKFGKGERPLIMIQGLNTNGIGGAAPMLAYAYRIFAKKYKVYLFDRRKNLKESVTVRDLAKDTAEAMDALGICDADVLGVSLGGMIAQYLAIDRPELVRRLVLALTLSRNNETVENAVNAWIDMTEKNDAKALVSDMAKRMYSEKYLKRYKIFMPLLTLMQKPKDPQRFITLARSCLTCNSYGELDKIKCKTLVIGAGKDEIVGTDASREMIEKLGCAHHIYEDLGHAAYEEAKDFNKTVLDFFENDNQE